MATRLVIEGGSPLRGEVEVSAAKNAALPAMAASLLTAQPLMLENVPALADVVTMRRLLERLGAETSAEAGGATRLQVARVASHEAPYELVSTMRASVVVLGPLLARTGVARVALPGGCAIGGRGGRPIDQHLKGLARLGADIVIENGYVEARASRLKGARITTDLVTVTGTENLMMAAALAEGVTVLENAAREPEVADLARLLSAMGARIEGAGTERIEIEGVPELGGARHRIIPDRIEAGTLLVAGAISGGDVTVTGAAPRHLTATLAKLEECGAALTVDGASGWPTGAPPEGSARSRKRSSRTASCTRPSCAAWVRGSRQKAPPPWCAASPPTRALRSWRPTCGLPPRSCWPGSRRGALPWSLASTTWIAAMRHWRRSSSHSAPASGGWHEIRAEAGPTSRRRGAQ